MSTFDKSYWSYWRQVPRSSKRKDGRRDLLEVFVERLGLVDPFFFITLKPRVE